MSEPSPEQSFSIHLKSLTDFADEFTTQIQSLQAPMDHLATMSGTQPQYGAFHEAWSLGAGEQAAVEEMFSLLGQVKTAIAFAGNVTGTVADGYKHADENVAWGLGGPPGSTSGGGSDSGAWQNNGHYEHPGQQGQYSDPTQHHHHGGENSGQQHQGGQGNQYGQNGQGSNHTAPSPWVPNQNTSGPFASPVNAVPLAGALLGGALLGGATKSKSHQSPANTSVGVTFDTGADNQSGALPLWTPPPDPGASAVPGQDAPWTATMPGSQQGGS